MNSHDSFLKRKFENAALTSCRLGPVLSCSTTAFELHAEMAEEIDLEKSDFWNFRSPVTLTLTLDRSKVTSACTCTATNVPDHVTVATRNTEIWPFEIRVISTFRKV